MKKLFTFLLIALLIPITHSCCPCCDNNYKKDINLIELSTNKYKLVGTIYYKEKQIKEITKVFSDLSDKHYYERELSKSMEVYINDIHKPMIEKQKRSEEKEVKKSEENQKVNKFGSPSSRR